MQRVQIQGLKLNENEDENEDTGEQEYLLDENGNIFDLNGNFVAAMGTDDEAEEQGEVQADDGN